MIGKLNDFYKSLARITSDSILHCQPESAFSIDSAVCSVINFVVSTHANRDNEHLDPGAVDPVDDPRLTGADAPTTGKLAAQGFSKLVRLAVCNAFVNYFQNDFRFGTAQTAQVLLDLGVLTSSSPSV